MSACDGTGWAIGCSGCYVCEADMAEMRQNKRAAADVLSDLARRRDLDPWTPTTEEGLR